MLFDDTAECGTGNIPINSHVHSKAGGPPMYVLSYFEPDQTYACRYYNGLEFLTTHCREAELVIIPDPNAYA